jgi:chromodomain-helicase-DNA-binding protein 4
VLLWVLSRCSNVYNAALNAQSVLTGSVSLQLNETRFLELREKGTTNNGRPLKIILVPPLPLPRNASHWRLIKSLSSSVVGSWLSYVQFLLPSLSSSTGACTRGGICMGCMDTALLPDASRTKAVEAPNDTQKMNSEDIIMRDSTLATSETIRSLARELLFRCFTCKRLAHYRHLSLASSQGGEQEPDLPDIAAYYQRTKNWLCSDCSSFGYDLDKIIAWRPYPANAKEPVLGPNQIPDYKSLLPREYLVKWVGRSYRRVQWVPHMWLVSTNLAKLKNFISGGTKVELLKQPAEPQEGEMEVDDTGPDILFEKIDNSRPPSMKSGDETSAHGALPDAERRIPVPWKTVDRILDVLLWRPPTKKPAPRPKRKKVAIMSEDEVDSDNDVTKRPPAQIYEKGEQPPSHLTETIDEWEEHDLLTKDDADSVVWAFIKWDGLGYDEGKIKRVSITVE